MNYVHEVDLYTDAGETGWGPQALGTFVGRVFDDMLIGTSSTFRELSALLEAVQEPRLARLLTTRLSE